MSSPQSVRPWRVDRTPPDTCHTKRLRPADERSHGDRSTRRFGWTGPVHQSKIRVVNGSGVGDAASIPCSSSSRRTAEALRRTYGGGGGGRESNPTASVRVRGETAGQPPPLPAARCRRPRSPVPECALREHAGPRRKPARRSTSQWGRPGAVGGRRGSGQRMVAVRGTRRISQPQKVVGRAPPGRLVMVTWSQVQMCGPKLTVRLTGFALANSTSNCRTSPRSWIRQIKGTLQQVSMSSQQDPTPAFEAYLVTHPWSH